MGGYRIEARIGRGGMGVVYRATHMALDKQVALKLIAEELAEDEGFRERFRREPKLAASIDHPNVIPVLDAGEAGERLFVAMRYVAGSDLRSLIADEGRLEPERAARIVAQVADALDAAHELGLVHRDVKPANVLIEDRYGREHVYLTDFGLTKGGEGATALTKTGQWVGTPDYVAPEQIHGGMLDRRTDIYALGAVLYHALCGQPPYGRETEVAKIYAHLSKPPPELPADVNASPELQATIRRAMAKEPGERYPTAGELGRDALAAAGERLPSEAAAPTVPAEPPGPTVAADAGTAPGETVAAPDKTAIPAAGTAPGETVAMPGEAAIADTGTAPRETAAMPGEAAVLPPRLAPSGIQRLLGNRRAVGVIAVLATGAFAAAGFLIGNSSGDGDTSAASFSNSHSSDALELDFPDDWGVRSQAVRVPGITFSNQISLATGGKGNRAGLVAGQVDAAGPRLLPDGFLERLGPKSPSGKRVKLGDLEALRYPNLRPKGYDGKLTLFTVPTTEGVATTACAAPAGTSESVTDECEQIATTLRLLKGQPFPLEPDERYANTLNREIHALNEARNTKLTQAGDAKKPDDQATSLSGLAQSYGDAAKRLRGTRASPAVQPANDAIVGALGAGRDAYTKMASAARSDSKGSYNAGRADAGRADAKLKAALKRLRALGYKVNEEKP